MRLEGELVKKEALIKLRTILWVAWSLESPSGVPRCFRRMMLDLVMEVGS